MINNILQVENDATPVPTQNGELPAAVSDDLDFSDLKKKKKSSKKKVAAELEAFEKELGEATVKEADEDGDDEEGEYDEDELGDDPFARGGELASAIDTGTEPWLGSDRDYTYQEVLLISTIS